MPIATGQIAIPQGQNSVTITGLALNQVPQQLPVCSVLWGSAGVPPQNISPTMVNGYTVNGFTVWLNAAPSESGYTLYWFIPSPPTFIAGSEAPDAHSQRSEPVQFACGDTLWFHKWLPEYSAASGWTLAYYLYCDDGSIPDGGAFTANASGNGFEISVPNYALAIDPSKGYTLAGYVTNPNISTGVRHQIYFGKLKLLPNLASGQIADKWLLEAHEYKMVRHYRALMEQLTKTYVNESDITGVKIRREKHEEIRWQLCFWEERLKNYVNHQMTKNGLPDQTLIRPTFSFSF